MIDFFAIIMKLNIVASLGILVVLFLRQRICRLFGAQASYRLWALVPLCCIAVFLPARTTTAPAPTLLLQESPRSEESRIAAPVYDAPLYEAPFPAPEAQAWPAAPQPASPPQPMGPRSIKQNCL